VLPARAEADALDASTAAASAALPAVHACYTTLATEVARLRAGADGDAAARDAAWATLLAAQRRHAELLQQQCDQQGQRAQRQSRLADAAAILGEEPPDAEENGVGYDDIGDGNGSEADVRGLVKEGSTLLATVRDTLQPLQAASQRAMQALRDCLLAEQAREEELAAAVAALDVRARACVLAGADALRRETPAQDAVATRAQQQAAEAELRRLEAVEATRRLVRRGRSSLRSLRVTCGCATA